MESDRENLVALEGFLGLVRTGWAATKQRTRYLVYLVTDHLVVKSANELGRVRSLLPLLLPPIIGNRY